MYLKLLFSSIIICSFVSSLAQNRMSHGVSLLQKQFPWVGILSYKVQKRSMMAKVTECLGTIIHKKYGLTAAHCVYYKKSSPEFTVGAVMADTNDAKTYAVRKFYVHDQFSLKVTHKKINQLVTDNYDVALMRFAKEIIFDEYTKPIQLQSIVDDNHIGKKCKFLSWGTPASNLEGAKNFMYQYSTVLNITDCITQSNSEWDIKNQLHICISTTFGAGTSCTGASGGPLVLDGKLAGLHSFGECGKKPSVFVRIPPVFDWIRRQMAQCGDNLFDQFDQGLAKSYEVILPDENKCEYSGKYSIDWKFVTL